jgi:uncharacterized protein (DUF433 family)
MEEIIVDPNIMAGKPIIRGTRIPVDAILRRIADEMTIEEILEEYPNLTKKKVKAALEYAERIIRGEDIIPKVKRKHKIFSG